MIYVVMGTTGEYSDREEWTVCAYLYENLAKEHVERADKEAARCLAESSRYDAKADEAAKVWDKNMRIDYTGTDYYILEIDIRENLPASD